MSLSINVADKTCFCKESNPYFLQVSLTSASKFTCPYNS
uniref:Uncharacterized protein n=1 Tax=Manihot esculenta TaxID=3983 RepID=A0A2C9UNU9_MANES